MCKAIDDLILKGKLEGRVEGELDKTKTIVKNMLRRGMADADICALLCRRTGWNEVSIKYKNREKSVM